jgi:GT2 family glycosyltransferase
MTDLETEIEASPVEKRPSRRRGDRAPLVADDRPAINLSTGPFTFHFSEEALLTRSHVNIHSGERIALHIKYVPLKGGFVLNDTDGGVWREEVFVECLRVPGGVGLKLMVALTAEGVVVEVRGHPPVVLGDRFDLVGDLGVVHAPIVTVTPGALDTLDVALADDSLTIRRIHSVEETGITLGVDAVLASGAAFFIEGWVDDRRSRLVGISLIDYESGERVRLAMGRTRRPDVDSHLAVAKPGEFGFWAVGFGTPEQLGNGALSLVFENESGVPIEIGRRTMQSAGEFFTTVLTAFGRRSVIGNLTARSFADLDGGLGEILGKLHRQIGVQRRVVTRSHFGRREEPSVSLVCVLYGFPDFLYLLIAQFARFGSLEGFEFIFVSNSPELDEVLVRDAELAAFVFGADVRVIGLNGNSGFSYANNVGVAAARGRTIAIINPDVFPRDAAAVNRLRELGASPPGEDIVGGKLFYADGSVMHEGMYFDRDRKLSALCRVPVWTVEHFRKGFPDTTEPVPREVPALSGALMVIEKALFERLNGFSTAFIFGHYEDADLCLRVKQAGGRVVLDPALAYWHYEGMGSIKQPEHVGSGLYNRWFFARSWGRRLKDFE